MTGLCWLPEPADWKPRLRALAMMGPAGWDEGVALANARLGFMQTNGLDEMMRRAMAGTLPAEPAGKPVRLAVLSSCTTAHLHAAIRVAGLRRGIPITIHEAEYGQYWQALTEPDPALVAFRPTAILLALDAHHLAAGVDATAGEAEADAAIAEVQARIVECWRAARERFGCPVLHQLPLPAHPLLLGDNEHRLPGSRSWFISRLAGRLRGMADAEGVLLVAADLHAARDGIAAWHDVGMWHRAKQEISLTAAPMYGELVGRALAAVQGRSAKCLVLDLDNTLWGGVIGDDGMEGIVLGQGSALGEAHAAFQSYAKELSRRGVILAVCSKNDEANALEPFERHPEMVLRRSDIACFVANWTDKPANLRAIAAELNIGLDSLVFADDNPFERNLVRSELPMVAVPELGDDPSSYAQTIADAGYFESIAITEEDRLRTGQYLGNRQRESLRSAATDLPSYLRGLEMRLVWRRFDRVGLARTVQLINKTNQFNLTTRRYTEAGVLAVMDDPHAFGLQLRLLDRFGDNGIIAIIIGRMEDATTLLIDSWLMSCRVLGRGVEAATLSLVAANAQRLGARNLVGEYIPTKKNAMVYDHYAKLGFTAERHDETGISRSVLDLAGFIPATTFITIQEG